MVRGSIDRLLVDLSQPEGSTTPEQIAAAWAADDPAFRSAVADHRLEAAVRDALRRVDAPVDPDLDLLVEDDRRVRLLAMRGLGAAAEALDTAAVPWLVFKGPAVYRLMARGELRTFNDLDLLVDAPAFADAVEALVDAGFDEINDNWSPYLQYRVGEVPMEMYGVTVDVHWHITGLGRDRSMFRLDPQAMVARRVRRTIGDTEVPVFDPVDQLLHLALHAGLEGATRLDQFRDLGVVIAGETLAWESLVSRASDAWIDGIVGHVLDRACRVGLADVPDDVVTELAGDASLARRRRIDGDAVHGLRGIPVLLRRRRRRDAAAMLGRQVLDRLPGSARRGWDFTEPQSRLYHGRPTGGASGRRAFLDAVSRGEL